MTLTLVELLRVRAEAAPDRTAYRFLGDDDSAETISYAELDRDARAVAGLLRERGAKATDRALLLYPPGLDYIRAFFGALYARVVPVPVYPPRSVRNASRLGSIATDARAGFALTVSPVLDLLGRDGAGLGLDALRAEATDGLDARLANRWAGQLPDAGSPAFLQYTSGSTAAPKGVVLSHGNLLHNLAMIGDAFGCDEDTSAVVWLPPYHDMGLIGGILTPLYAGFPVTLMSSMSFLRRPLGWLRAVSTEGAQLSGGPNFAYEMCARLATDADRAELDLSTWRVAFNGAEPIRASTLDAFEEAFGDCGFRRSSFLPCYGMAEATLFVTGATAAAEPTVLAVDAAGLESGRADEPGPDRPARQLVGTGRPAADQQVLIVEPGTREPLPERRIGEIWVHGPSVAQGYWDNPAATGEAFAARPAGQDNADGRTWLRTGDLGFLAGGELFVTGRHKDLIIVRGRNFYPTDIELAVEAAHPSFRSGCGAAVAAEHDGEQVLVVLQEVEGRALATIDVAEATAAVRAAVMDRCDVAVHEVLLLKPGAIPKTTSGKIQRSLSRQRHAAGGFEPLGGGTAGTAAASTEPGPAEVAALDSAGRTALVLEVLRRRIADALGGTTEQVATTGVPLTSLGIDSLAAVLLVNRIREDLGVELPLSRMLGGADLAALAAEATLVTDPATGAESGAASGTVAAPAAESDGPGTTLGQRSIWHVQQQSPGASAYNIPVAVELAGPLDTDALRAALRQVSERHEILRTRYRVTEGEIVPFRADDPVELHVTDARADGAEQLAERAFALAHRPFDLEHDPVFRADLLVRAGDRHVLLLTVHHIAADLWSVVNLTAELGRGYTALAAGTTPAPEAPAGRYADQVRRERRLLAGPTGRAMLDYWRQELAGPQPLLDLPLDAPHPATPSYRGGRVPFRVDAGRTARVRAFAKETGTTLYTVLLAAFQIALHHASGSPELVVGTAAANRGAKGAEDVVGYFTNMVAVRGSFEEGVTPRAFTGRLHQTVLSALDHQACPISLVLETVQPRREPGRNPLFQAVFVLQRPHAHAETAGFVLGMDTGAATSWGRLRLTPYPLPHRTAQYELMLTVVDAGPELHAALEYSSDIFTESTAERLAAHYRTVLDDLLERPDTPVAELCPAELLARRATRDAGNEEDALTRYVAPRTDTERILAKIWSEVLGVEPVGVEDDFFELGGHSLLAVQLISGVRDALGVDVPVRSVMQTRTVAQGAAIIDALLWAKEGAASADAGREEGEL
ncbi:AMP-binding protein [Streptomyces sp. JJ66]|uniref:condensation domain-containing protein n=1 Tax=Streptomyces sp. JJ66 TaxID=2803843 RepID=UPI001C5869C6|nr:condensation domain-containing protein [Streptomyces sp. JJ66]MBW1600733.1 AMP-binding protein [Streptomyces sp. JJ66]